MERDRNIVIDILPQFAAGVIITIQATVLMLWTAPTTGIAMCHTAEASA